MRDDRSPFALNGHSDRFGLAVTALIPEYFDELLRISGGMRGGVSLNRC